MKTSDDRIEFVHRAAAIELTESGETWVSFSDRAFVSKVNETCDEVLRVPLRAMPRAITAIEANGVAVLLSGSKDLWSKRGPRRTTISCIATDGAERSSVELADTFATAIVAPNARRFVLVVNDLATTVSRDGTVQPNGTLAYQLERAPRSERVWAVTRWRMVSLATAQPTAVMSLAWALGYERLGLSATQSGAWALYRTNNLGASFVLTRLVPQSNPVGYLPAPTIVVEQVLPLRPVAVKSTLEDGAWVLFDDGSLRRYDATGAEQCAVELDERAAKPRSIACNSEGTEVGVLFESETGSVLRRVRAS